MWSKNDSRDSIKNVFYVPIKKPKSDIVVIPLRLMNDMEQETTLTMRNKGHLSDLLRAASTCCSPDSFPGLFSHVFRLVSIYGFPPPHKSLKDNH